MIAEVAVEVDPVGVRPPVGVDPVGVGGAQQIEVDVALRVDDGRDAGEFTLFAVPRPGVSLETLERALDQALGGVMASAPAAADLERAKTQLVASALYRRDHGTDPASEQALIGPYLKSLPDDGTGSGDAVIDDAEPVDGRVK